MNRVPVALAAHAAQVEPCTIRQWIARGKLTRHRDGIDLNELLTCIDSRDPAALAVRATPQR